MLQDVIHSLRVIGRTPGLTAVTIITLALGIGANTAIFSVVNGALLKPLPYPGAERIVQISREFPDESWPTASIPKFFYWHTHNQTFSSLAAFELLPSGYNMTGDGLPERIRGLRVTAEFFSVFGVRPSLGRGFLAEEDAPGGPRVVVLGDGLWKRRFGGDASIVGRDVVLNDEKATVVGVMPPGFSFPVGVELWAPYQLDPLSRDQNKSRQAIGRLREGLDLEDARAAMVLLGKQHRSVDPELVAETEMLALTPLREHLYGSLRPALLVLLAAVGFVLLIACVNVANLQLARSAGRRREVAIRTALGARGSRIARQLLTESVLLSLAGGIAGLLLGYWLLRPIVALGPASIRELPSVEIDATVIGFTFAIALATGLIFGLLPALQAVRGDLINPLREASSRTAGGPTGLRTRRVLVIGEVAMALVLLIAASLLAGSFRTLREIDPGFEASQVLTLRLPLAVGRYGDVGALDRLNRRLAERVRAVPGVESMGLASTLPFDVAIDLPFAIEGRYRDRSSQEGIGDGQYRAVGGQYFQTLRVALRRGRTFTDADGPGAVGVAIINETAARRYWPNEDPIGQRITPGMPYVPELADSQPRTIVGIVADVREISLDSDPPAIVYVPLSQIPQAVAGLLVGSLPEALVVRASGAPADVARGVQDAIREIDSSQPVTDVLALDEIVSRSVGPAWFNTLLLGLLSGVALLLAAVGIYGVVSHLVTARTREIGVRMALGASRQRVLGLMLGQAMTTVLTGVGLGMLAAALVTRSLSSMLFGISATDPVTFAASGIVLVIVALVATLLPARRAAGLDPIVALRSE